MRERKKKKKREKQLFSILIAEHPIRKKKKQTNRQTLIFLIAISLIAESRIPGVLPDPSYQIEQNLLEEF